MSKEYKIETVHDCMKIPLDRFNLFLDEFNEVLMFARATHEVNKLSSGIEEPITIKSFTWTDDDKGEIRIKVTPVPRTPDTSSPAKCGGPWVFEIRGRE